MCIRDSHLPTRWNALAVVLALASMLGCQGLSTSKPASQGSQNPLPGGLNAAPASISFGNVQIGTSQSQSDTVINTGGTSLTITQATVTGSGFSTTGLNLPPVSYTHLGGIDSARTRRSALHPE